MVPTQRGPLLETVGEAGITFTTTLVVADPLVQPFDEDVTEYVPEFIEVTFVITGFCKLEVNPFGPVQLYTPPDCPVVLRFKVDPSHSGPLLEAVGATGIRFTTTLVVAAVLVQPLAVVVTE